jgi:serine/threonine protein kinase
LARERQAPGPPEFIAGALAYMAPEQTGRMNRSIDSRSDLYALGVVLYEMLTGALPFTAADPVEWIHCHIARRPIAPADRLGNLPAPISAIIVKLLAKTAEERYQTAAGVESDLRRCFAEWKLRGGIDPFALGEHDTPDRLLSCTSCANGPARSASQRSESPINCTTCSRASGASAISCILTPALRSASSLLRSGWIASSSFSR